MDAPAPAANAVVTVVGIYPSEHGPLRLRGSGGGLEWDDDRMPDRVEGDESHFRIEVAPGEQIEAKLVRADGTWMSGRNFVIARGEERIEIRPSFERANGKLLAPETIEIDGYGPLTYRVLLPPGYEEQPDERHPVIWAQDGQALWSDGTDPFGLWNLDHALDELWDLGALEDVIVVSIDTSEQRLERLGPVPDAKHGGGEGPKHLAAIIDVLKPKIEREYRTRTEPMWNALLGSSMGGLFSFWAAWTRPDVFGRAICLSPSFWWGDRWMLRQVRAGTCPVPRPSLYLDTGAARSSAEPDASTRDGFQHTRAIYRALLAHCYEPTDDVQVLTFAGHRHDAQSWSARIGVPLQMAFPRWR